MSKASGVVYLTIGITLLTAIFLVYVYLDSDHILFSITMPALMVVYGLVALRTPTIDGQSESRDAAQTLSLVPGLGCLYLRDIFWGILLLSLTVTCACIFILLPFGMKEYFIVRISCMVYIGYLTAISMVRTAYVCDLKGLDYEMGLFELSISNVYRCILLTTTIIASLLTLALVWAGALDVHNGLMLCLSLPLWIISVSLFLARYRRRQPRRC